MAISLENCQILLNNIISDLEVNSDIQPELKSESEPKEDEHVRKQRIRIYFKIGHDMK